MGIEVEKAPESTESRVGLGLAQKYPSGQKVHAGADGSDRGSLDDLVCECRARLPGGVANRRGQAGGILRR